MLFRNRWIVLLSAIMFTSHSFAKDFPKSYDSPMLVSKSDQKKLEKAREIFDQTMSMWTNLTTTYNPENITHYKIDSAYNKDAYPKLVKIAEMFDDCNTTRFNIYIENCYAFWEKNKYNRPQGLEVAKKCQKEAIIYFEKAKMNRRAAISYAGEYKKAYDRVFEAVSLEIIAAKKAARALQYYRDWPVHYPYAYDEDVEVDLFDPKKPVVAARVEPKPVEIKPEPIKEEKKPVVVVQAQPDSVIIFYKVQLAAHTVKLSKDYLRANIFNGDEKVEEIKEDGWYKYLIGKFLTQEEASNLMAACKAKNQIRVNNAFVTAYKNGKRVFLKEVKNTQKNK